MESISIPDTPAGRQVGRWLDCLEGGELDRLSDFPARHFSAAAVDQLDAEARVAHDVAVVYRDTHGLVPTRVQPSSGTELRLLARAQLTGGLLGLWLVVEELPPHRIIGMHVDFVPPAHAPYESIISESKLVDELRDFVELLDGADCFSGAVLHARGEEVLLECAHGLARRASDVPNRPETRFNHAWIQKMFTAVAIAQLAEQGRLDFADNTCRLRDHLQNLKLAFALCRRLRPRPLDPDLTLGMLEAGGVRVLRR